MMIPRWNPPVETSSKEDKLLKRVKRHRKLFGFMRRHRHELFDEAFQAELETMYRATGAGHTPTAPALLCMVLLLQSYAQVSDAEAVEASILDARWKLVLDCLECEEPVFSQGGLQQFRERLIAHDMDKRLLQRTVELARKHKGFDWRKLPKTLRVAIDSRPLEGAGRVEDTFNLLGHAARKVLACASKMTKIGQGTISQEAQCPLFLASSVKAGLDVADWSDKEQKTDAINELVEQVESLVNWVERNLKPWPEDKPIQRYLKALEQVEEQNLERESDGTVSLRDGVAKDRRISIEDPEMRHGRKSKNKTFNGYKEHIASAVGERLILACAVTPANAPEYTTADTLTGEILDQGFEIEEMLIDRGYVKSKVVEQVEQDGGEVLSKPWRAINTNGLFTKADFEINVRDKKITCPSGQVEDFEFGKTVEFNPHACAQCPLRNECTTAALGRGRTVSILEDEARQKRWRKQRATKEGRERLRDRTAVEHDLAHISARKKRRARYRGVRKNEYDLRRTAAVQNLETINRNMAA